MPPEEKPESVQDTILATLKDMGAEDAFGPSSEIDEPPGRRTAEDDGERQSAVERLRDEHGRFVRKDDAEETEAEPEKGASPVEKAAETETETEEPDIEPPDDWKAENQEAFRKLPKEAKAFISERQKEWTERYEPAAREAQQLRQAIEPFAQVLAPYNDYFQRSGIHPAQHIGTLLALAKQAQEQPEQFLREQARAHGVDLAKLAGAPATEEEEWVDPAIKSLEQRFQAELARRDEIIQRLGGGVGTMQQQRVEAETNQVRSALQQFVSEADESGRPKHPYFNEVREDMAVLLRGGRARDLADAYERAVHANPETRAKLAAAERSAAERRAVKEAREKAEQARRAGGSVVGEGAAGPNSPQIPTDSPMATAFAVARQAGWQI